MRGKLSMLVPNLVARDCFQPIWTSRPVANLKTPRMALFRVLDWLLVTPASRRAHHDVFLTGVHGRHGLQPPLYYFRGLTMSQYSKDIQAVAALRDQANGTWNAINPESAARMRAQNRFKTGLDIAKYTAKIMRQDMAEYDKDHTKYTQSLGCWHGFIGQQKLISIKKHLQSTKGRYLYLSGWMIAALRSEFGPLPDQSMHEKTTVPALIEELYTFLIQADAWELNHYFRDLDAAREAGDKAKETEILAKIDNFETHVVPIIADIDAGFGNEEATYL